MQFARFFAAVLCVTIATPLAAQPWPTRTLRIVTATPAGGSPDFVSRLIGDKLTDRLGQAVVVENAAASGVAAWNNLAKAQPDGHTVGMLTGAFSARAAVAKSLPYDPIKDFAFVTLVSGYPMVVATAPSSPIKSFGDLIARAKAAPDTITYGMNAARQRSSPDRRADQRRSRHLACVAFPTGEIPRSCRTCWAAGSTSWSKPEPLRSRRSKADPARLGGLVARAVRAGAGHPGDRRNAPRLRGDVLARPRHAGRNAAPDRRSAQPRDRRDPQACRTSAKSSPASAMSRLRPRPSRCRTISSATPPAGAGSSRSRRSSGIDGFSHRTPAARRYCKSTNRSAAGSGGLITPPSPMNAITWASPLRSISASLGMTPLSGSK